MKRYYNDTKRKTMTENDFVCKEDNGSEGAAAGLVITKYTGGDKVVNIPPQINGKPVTGIGSRAFANNNLESVAIPTGITVILEGVFERKSLKNITFHNKVTNIGDGAFIGENGKNNIPTVIIPNHTKLGRSPFNWNIKIFRQNGQQVKYG
jgi:hypothetical protein